MRIFRSDGGDWAMEMLQNESLLKSDNDKIDKRTNATEAKRLYFFWDFIYT